MNETDLTALFCVVDDFVQANVNNNQITNWIKHNKTGPKPRLTTSEVVTVIIYYHTSGYDCFKHYYVKKILKDHQQDFKLVSYQQFVKLIPQTIMVIMMFMQYLLKACTGTSFVDSTSLEVCKNYRINRHKVFEGLAARGKTTKGWFFGFKLHLVITATGDLVKVRFTSGNRDDRKALLDMTNGLFGKVVGDKGYIGKDVAQALREEGIQIITRIKKGMQNVLMDVNDKILLLRRALIETVIGKLKLLGKLEHSRHRSIQNAFIHMIACLTNYQMQDNKPSIISLLT